MKYIIIILLLLIIVLCSCNNRNNESDPDFMLLQPGDTIRIPLRTGGYQYRNPEHVAADAEIYQAATLDSINATLKRIATALEK